MGAPRRYIVKYRTGAVGSRGLMKLEGDENYVTFLAETKKQEGVGRWP